MFTSYCSVFLLAVGLFVNGSPILQGPDDGVESRGLSEEDDFRSNDDVLDCHFTCVGGDWLSWLWRDGCNSGCDIYPSTASPPTTDPWNSWWWKEQERQEQQEPQREEEDAEPQQNQTKIANTSSNT